MNNYSMKIDKLQGLITNITERDHLLDLEEKRKLTEKVVDLVMVWDTNKALEIYDCGSFIKFENQVRGKEVIRKRLSYANFCKNRICPTCQWRKSRALFSDLTRVTEYINQYYKKRWLFLTLTVKNCDPQDLKETIRLLNSSYTKLFRKRKGKHHNLIADNTLGSFKAVEVTYNKQDGTLHPHLHCLVCVDNSYFKNKNKYIKHETWVEEWQKALGVDYKPTIDVRAVDNKDNGSIREVAKYTIKGSDLIELENKEEASNVLREVYYGLKGARLYTYSGLLKGVKKKLEEDGLLTTQPLDKRSLVDGNIVDIEEGDVFLETIYSWNFGIKTYDLTRIKSK